MESNQIIAYPIRIIPFDLGRLLLDDDCFKIREYIGRKHNIGDISARQKAILKEFELFFAIDDSVSGYLYRNGILVIVICENGIVYRDDYRTFSLSYGKERKLAHSDLFNWTHEKSSQLWDVVSELKKIVKLNTKRKDRIRNSASESFEHRGLSYVMTLSMFETAGINGESSSFKNYPTWLKNNIYALLEPAVVYLEDSGVFHSTNESKTDQTQMIEEIEIETEPQDYERHRHIKTYMSWAAVAVFGHINAIDREEYVTLEVQLQCDWFYVYCLEKDIDGVREPSKKDVFLYQSYQYQMDIMENRLFDFDDSSMPLRILSIQKGLVETSGLSDNIKHLKRRIQYALDREKLNAEIHQKRLGKESEVLLFIIAFIEIAPTVAEYGEKIFHNIGIAANILILAIGTFLMLKKND